MIENDKVTNVELKDTTENLEMFSEYGDIVSIEDVMSMLHIGRSAVYTLLRNKSIKNVMVARKYIIPKKSVIRFLEETASWKSHICFCPDDDI